ncbi:MAG: type 2 isopentenyl-diphosphate Delta-isomerase [Myxococcota bacterium]
MQNQINQRDMQQNCAVNERKLQHINIIQQDAHVDRNHNYFDQIHLTHRALPEIDLDAVDTHVEFMGKRLTFPLLISCMTGGDHEQLHTINRNLATAAQQAGVAMGVGSQRVMFTHPEAQKSFQLREYAPSTLLFANLGAIQLNNGMDASSCQQALDVVGADALCLHLNPLQEAVQPEGDTNFGGLAARIKQVVQGVNKPVVVKEVGAGISAQDAQLLMNCGVKTIDVAGSGGTSWSRIEHHRHTTCQNSVGELLQDWGIPTPIALKNLSHLRSHITLIASGGIRSGLDMVKAMILGASLCGMAKPFLQPAMQSAQSVLKLIRSLHRQFQIAMFLLGVKNVKQLQGNTQLICQWSHQ